MRNRLFALTLAALAVSAVAPAAIGAAQPAHRYTVQQDSVPQGLAVPQAASCGGVWVVVDFGSLGGTSAKCASSYSTGLAALRSAGFSPVVEDGFVYTLLGKPSKPDVNKAYWSYWHATRQSDGSYSRWSYSTLGASSSRPKQGIAEGWSYVTISGGNTPPSVQPPAALESSTPTPTKTTSKPTPKPTKTTAKPARTASATQSASATTKASATASGSTKATSKASSKASAKPSSTSSVTPAAASEPTDTGTEQPADSESGVAQEQPSAVTDPGTNSGSPVAALVVGSTVVAAGAGLGGWWLLKGRQP